jgi:hypothetical protein
MDQAAAMYEHLRVASAGAERPDLAAAIRELGDAERALHELGSMQARRDLADDWLPMIRQLRAEKVELDRKVAKVRDLAGLPERTLAWDDMADEDRWGALRSMAPAGALVGPFVGRGRNAKPADRLGFIVDDVEGSAVTDGEAP